MSPYDNAVQAADHLREVTGEQSIDMALVLGSGWSAGADLVGETVAELPLDSIPGFSAPVVGGHGGQLSLRRTKADKLAAVLTGRTHLYEGRGVAPVVHGVRTMAAWGAARLVLTNGCGGLRPDWAPGTVVMLTDHINLTGATPLVGATFIDMSEAYSAELRSIVHEIEPSLPTGVYVQFHGPQYETPAEVSMASIMGGDLVGMSTTLETLAAREAGMEVLGLSLVTNYAAGLSPENLSHAEVIEAGKNAGPRLAALLEAVAAKL